MRKSGVREPLKKIPINDLALIGYSGNTILNRHSELKCYF